MEYGVKIRKLDYKEWFELRGFILFPDDEDMREAYSNYELCRWILSSYRKREKYIEQYGVERSLRKAISLVSNEKFVKRLCIRKASSVTAGVLLRLLMSVERHDAEGLTPHARNFFAEPSLSKAEFLFPLGYEKRRAEKRLKLSLSFSEPKMKQYRKLHKDVCHLCAAKIHADPMKVVKGISFRERFAKFLAISEEYRSFARGFEQSRCKMEIGSEAMDYVYDISANLILPKIDSIDLLYSRDRIAKMSRDYRSQPDVKRQLEVDQ